MEFFPLNFGKVEAENINLFVSLLSSWSQQHFYTYIDTLCSDLLARFDISVELFPCFQALSQANKLLDPNGTFVNLAMNSVCR